jgi:hypothetical protein
MIVGLVPTRARPPDPHRRFGELSAHRGGIRFPPAFREVCSP